MAKGYGILKNNARYLIPGTSMFWFGARDSTGLDGMAIEQLFVVCGVCVCGVCGVCSMLGVMCGVCGVFWCAMCCTRRGTCSALCACVFVFACGRLSLPSSNCLLYTSPSPRDATLSRMPSSA